MQRDPKVVQFYSSGVWKKCRASYRKSVGGLCERCLKMGIYTPGEIVHHCIEHVTPENVENPEVTLSFNNLELLCRDCHAKEHEEIYGHERRRYLVDDSGRVVAR